MVVGVFIYFSISLPMAGILCSIISCRVLWVQIPPMAAIIFQKKSFLGVVDLLVVLLPFHMQYIPFHKSYYGIRYLAFVSTRPFMNCLKKVAPQQFHHLRCQRRAKMLMRFDTSWKDH